MILYFEPGIPEVFFDCNRSATDNLVKRIQSAELCQKDKSTGTTDIVSCSKYCLAKSQKRSIQKI